MQRAPIDGVELEYEVRGSGDPVVLIHAGVSVCLAVVLGARGESGRAHLSAGGGRELACA